jgi:hypothetical protein
VLGPAGQQGDVAVLAPPRVVGQLEGSGPGDPQAELRRRAGEGGGGRGALRILARQHQNPAPVPDRQILRQRIRQHGAAGQGVQQHRGAALGPQPVVRVADVEQDQVVAAAQRRHDRLQPVQWQVEQNRARAGGAHGCDRIRAGDFTGGKFQLLKLEPHPQRAAAHPALAQCRAGAVNRRHLVAQRQPGIAALMLVGGIFGAAEIENREQRLFRRRGWTGHSGPNHQYSKRDPANHQSVFHTAPPRPAPI